MGSIYQKYRMWMNGLGLLCFLAGITSCNGSSQQESARRVHTDTATASETGSLKSNNPADFETAPLAEGSLEGLAALPNLGQFFGTSAEPPAVEEDSEAELSLTSSEAPKLKDLVDNLDKSPYYVSSNLSSMVKKIKDLSERGKQKDAEEEKQKFDSAYATCRTLHAVGLQLNSVKASSQGICLMNQVAQSTAAVLTHKSGEKVERQNIFSQAEFDRVRKIEIKDPGADDLKSYSLLVSIPGDGIAREQETLVESSAQGEQELEPVYRSTSEGSSEIFEAEIVKCDSSQKMIGLEKIQINRTDGLFELNAYLKSIQKTQNQDSEIQWHSQMRAKLSDGESTELRFHPDVPRVLTSERREYSDKDNFNILNAEMNIGDHKSGHMTLDVLSKLKSVSEASNIEGNDKNSLLVKYSGSTIEDFVVHELAVRSTSNFDTQVDLSGIDSLEVGIDKKEVSESLDKLKDSDQVTERSVKYERRKTPRYHARNTSGMLKDLKKNNQFIEQKSEPEQPNMAALQDDKCQTKPDSVYSMSFASIGSSAEIKKYCAPSAEMDLLCDEMKENFEKIQQATNSLESR